MCPESGITTSLARARVGGSGGVPHSRKQERFPIVRDRWKATAEDGRTTRSFAYNDTKRGPVFRRANDGARTARRTYEN